MIKRNEKHLLSAGGCELVDHMLKHQEGELSGNGNELTVPKNYNQGLGVSFYRTYSHGPPHLPSSPHTLPRHLINVTHQLPSKTEGIVFVSQQRIRAFGRQTCIMTAA